MSTDTYVDTAKAIANMYKQDDMDSMINVLSTMSDNTLRTVVGGMQARASVKTRLIAMVQANRNKGGVHGE